MKFAFSLPAHLRRALPGWAEQWLDVIVPLVQVVLILAAAWLLRALVRRLISRLSRRYDLPPEVAISARRLSSFLIYFAALLFALERFGVSGTVLWTAFTGFAAVGAVAFFAAWSVLSNIFCALLILITRPFRLHDEVELLDGGDKPGLRGRVIDMNLVYVTLRETHVDGGEALLRIPNSQFFQRVTRRWRTPAPPTILANGNGANGGGVAAKTPAGGAIGPDA